MSTLSFSRRLVEDMLFFIREEINDDGENCMLLGCDFFFETLSTMMFQGKCMGSMNGVVGFQ